MIVTLDENDRLDDPSNPSVYLATVISTQLQPEKRLMLAILKDAADCIKKFAEAPKDLKPYLLQELEQEAGEAVGWVENNDDEWLFSFRNICDELKLDLDFLRKGLLRLLAR